MKRLFTFCFTFILLFSLVPAAVVAQEEPISVILDGKTLSFDVPPMLVNDRTMVPMRAIFTALGAEVDWDEESQTAISVRDGVTIRIQIGSAQMEADGVAVPLDAPAMLVNDRTLVPLRAVSEAFGVTVDWQGDTNTVLLNSPTPTPPVPTPTATAVSTPAPTFQAPEPDYLGLSEEEFQNFCAIFYYFANIKTIYDALPPELYDFNYSTARNFPEILSRMRDFYTGTTAQAFKSANTSSNLKDLYSAVDTAATCTKDMLSAARTYLKNIGQWNEAAVARARKEYEPVCEKTHTAMQQVYTELQKFDIYLNASLPLTQAQREEKRQALSSPDQSLLSAGANSCLALPKAQSNLDFITISAIEMANANLENAAKQTWVVPELKKFQQTLSSSSSYRDFQLHYGNTSLILLRDVLQNAWTAELDAVTQWITLYEKAAVKSYVSAYDAQMEALVLERQSATYVDIAKDLLRAYGYMF